MQFNLYRQSDVLAIKRAFDGRVVGLTSGSFDLYHHMHRLYLVRCRRLCEVLIVGVDSDDLIKKTKGENRPIIPEHQRLFVVEGDSAVDAAFILGNAEDFGLATELLGVKRIFKNQEFAKIEVYGAEKAELVIITDVGLSADSTTSIIDKVLANDPSFQRRQAQRSHPK